MADVFISYPHEAKSDASLFASVLQTKGVSAWVAETDLPAGQGWQQKIEEALSNAGAIVFLVYPHWEPSPWIQHESMQALESYWSGKTKFLVPLLIGAKAEPPGFLKPWQSLRVETKSDWDRVASKLVQWIRSDQQVRSEPGKKEKQELNQRLDAITKQAQELQFSGEQTIRGDLSSSAGTRTVFRSSRTGEFRQVGTKKSRHSKAKK
jgi:hypothetical protein